MMIFYTAKDIKLDIEDGSFDETNKAIRQAKAMQAFNSMRQTAANNGYLTDEEIEAEIAAARKINHPYPTKLN